MTQNSLNTQTTSCDALVLLCHKHFVAFYNFIWGFSLRIMEGEFKTGEHIHEWCNLFQNNLWLSILSARKHSKSEIAHAYIGWRIFNMDYTYLEKWIYFSYAQEQAEDHIKETKERIAVNPFFRKEKIENLTNAETILYYRKGPKRLFCAPGGILTAKRGKHPDGVITDDILRDPEKKLDIGQIIKITQIFMEQIMSMPKEGGLGLRNIGTAQDDEDVFHTLEQRKQFKTGRYPARVDYKTKTTLWPEMFSWARLDQIEFEEIGPKAFQKEFMCVPVRSTESFFTHAELGEIIYKRLRNYEYWRKLRLNEYTFGGLDIGKKRHPSHLSIYGRDRRKRLVQLLSLWLDSTDYVKQLEICRAAIQGFKIQRLYYDDTRAEFEGFKEAGDLPPEMKGLPFTEKLKFQIATEFEKVVVNKSILMLSDIRQKRQILNVDNDLKSMETPEGHGDSFWSNALAIHASFGGNPQVLYF